MKYAVVTVAIVLLCAIVCVAEEGESGGKKATRHAVAMDGMKFSPDKLDIKVGDTVEWTNEDDRDHNVTAKDGSFKSGNLSHGEKYSFTFKKAGKYAYSCSLHPRMKGTINVSEDK
jgi:plastocyanin